MGLIHIESIFGDSESKLPNSWATAVRRLLWTAAVVSVGTALPIIVSHFLGSKGPKSEVPSPEAAVKMPVITAPAWPPIRSQSFDPKPNPPPEIIVRSKPAAIPSLSTTIPADLDPAIIPPAPPRADPSFATLPHNADRIPTLNDSH
jgi:hypothetical protein